MPTYNVGLEEFAEIIRTLPQFSEAAIVRGLRSSALRLVGLTVEQISEMGIVDTGELASSVDYRRLSNGGRVAVDAPHAGIMEMGTRPFTPPIEPLKEWALRKGLADNEKDAKAIAFAIRGAFQKHGIKPRHYMAEAIQKVIPIIGEEIRAELHRPRTGGGGNAT